MALTMKRSVRLAATMVVATAMVACTPPMQRAETAYSEGRYLEVAEDLAHSESELTQLPVEQRARYGVYRGLSLMKLGEYDGAQRWLRYALDVERGRPSLEAHQRRALDEGWSSLQALRGPAAGSPAEGAPQGAAAVEQGSLHGVRSGQSLAPAK
jgi:tetratricopeptide (TPR) repeat protein